MSTLHPTPPLPHPPQATNPPTQINVWRGAHVWHVANTTIRPEQHLPDKLSAGADPRGQGRAQEAIDFTVHFEALPGLDYLIERQCIRSMKAGYVTRKGRRNT